MFLSLGHFVVPVPDQWKQISKILFLTNAVKFLTIALSTPCASFSISKSFRTSSSYNNTFRLNYHLQHLGKKSNLADYQYLDINIKHPSSNTEKGSFVYYLSKVKFHGIIPICQAACIICERKRRWACIHVQFEVIHFEYRFICCYVVMSATPNTPEISSATKAPTIIRHHVNKFCPTS